MYTDILSCIEIYNLFLLLGTESVRCEGLVGVCTFRYFVAADETPNPTPNANPFLDLHVEFLRCKYMYGV